MAFKFKDYIDATGLTQINKIRQIFNLTRKPDRRFIRIFKIIINIIESSTEDPRAGDNLGTIKIKGAEVEIYEVKVNHFVIVYSIMKSPPEVGLLCFFNSRTEKVKNQDLIDRARSLHS